MKKWERIKEQVLQRKRCTVGAVASVLWGSVSSALGYFGGQAFAEELWKSAIFALGIAAAIALVGEIYRRRQACRAS